ncbi:MAG TPA: oxidoreductase [Acidobacteriaceae bacterium]|nr:oxidoreductase [Acidobacteriaceae bacterium]
MNPWTAADIPPQSGKLALVTGANSGVGFQAALELARAGARVILGCRNIDKANAARNRILAEVPAAQLEPAALDLASLASIRAFAQTFLAQPRSLDLLINNAGVMAIPTRQLTADGFELQIGTNHLGHFALTGLLLPDIFTAPSPRIVTVSSIAHRGGSIRFDDLNWTRDYKPWPAYRQTKLANLYFAFDLDRRLQATHPNIASIAVHPGVAKTNLFAAGPGQKKNFEGLIAPLVISIFGQSEQQGALPTLYGATAPEARSGRFYGSHGFREMRGYPVEVTPEAQAYDEPIAARLWNLSEELTGVHYQF